MEFKLLLSLQRQPQPPLRREKELGWNPKLPSILEELEHGSISVGR